MAPPSTLGERLSSRSTVAYKRLGPALWLAFATFLGWMSWGRAGGPSEAADLALPALLGVGVLALLGWVLRGLADEVVDGGDYLAVRQGGHVVRVPLHLVASVRSNHWTSPPVVTLELREPTLVGDRVRFVPRRLRTGPYGSGWIGRSLRERVESSRVRAD